MLELSLIETSVERLSVKVVSADILLLTSLLTAVPTSLTTPVKLLTAAPTPSIVSLKLLTAAPTSLIVLDKTISVDSLLLISVFTAAPTSFIVLLKVLTAAPISLTNVKSAFKLIASVKLVAKLASLFNASSISFNVSNIPGAPPTKSVNLLSTSNLV